MSSSILRTTTPSQTIVHGTLLLVQVLFASAGVIAAVGLPTCNPFAFVLYREIAAGGILLLVAVYMTNCRYSSSSTRNPRRNTNSTETISLDHDPSSSVSQTDRLLAHRQHHDGSERLVDSFDDNQDESTTDDNQKRFKSKSTHSFHFSQTSISWLPWHFQSSSQSSSSMNYSSSASWTSFLALGFMIFGNQAFVILGVKLAGPVACSIWQPSQPIITSAICMMMGWEAFHVKRMGGIVLAFVGCVLMVVLSTTSSSTTTPQEPSSTTTATDHESDTTIIDQPLDLVLGVPRSLIGHVCFFINCLCTSLYVILSKPALQRYPPLFVTAWSYNVASVIMAVVAWSVAQSPTWIKLLICPDCQSFWIIPPGAYFALFYFIVFNSVIAYAMLTWANQFVTGTLVMGYTVLQPVTTATLTVALLATHTFPSCLERQQNHGDNATHHAGACLEPPGMGTLLGMVSVFAGLFLVVSTEPSSNTNENGAQAVEMTIATTGGYKDEERRDE